MVFFYVQICGAIKALQTEPFVIPKYIATMIWTFHFAIKITDSVASFSHTDTVYY